MGQKGKVEEKGTGEGEGEGEARESRAKGTVEVRHGAEVFYIFNMDKVKFYIP